MKAISSTAATKQETNYKFNAGTNLESSFDVDYYETYFRNYDAQTGRFTGIDAMSEQTMSLSTYLFGGNNPMMFNDPTGLKYEPSEITDKWTYGYHDPFAGMEEVSTYLSSGGGGSYAYYDPEYGYAEGPGDAELGRAIENSSNGGYFGTDGNFVALSAQHALAVGITYNNTFDTWGKNYDRGWAASGLSAQQTLIAMTNTDNSIFSYASYKTVPFKDHTFDQVNGPLSFSRLYIHYLFSSEDDYIISQKSFNGLLKALQEKGVNFNNLRPVDGVDGLYKMRISAYGTNFENPVGFATLYFNNGGVAVGFSDYWNFDSHNFSRPGSGDAKTTFGSYLPGAPFLVLYGQTPPDDLIPKH